MNTEIKHKWIKALRSNDYKKSINALKRFFKTVEPSYCCMGVLCDIIKDDHKHAEILLEQNPTGSLYNATVSRYAILDMETLTYTGISSEHQRRLTSMNDKGVSWEKIADYIERRL